MAEMCHRAWSLGISAICFTDHVDFEPHEEAYDTYDPMEISREIGELSGRYRGRLAIYHGVEINLNPDRLGDMRDFISSYPFDLVIGSVHNIGRIDYAPPPPADPPQGVDSEVFYRTYWEAQLLCLENYIALDVVAHMDLARRFGRSWYREDPCRPGGLLWPLVERAVRAAVARGMVLEINCAGLRHPLRELYPSTDLLDIFLDAGGRDVTLGSDAHQAGHVGFGLTVGAAGARGLGLNVLTVPPRLASA